MEAADYNADGFLDVYIGNFGQADDLLLYNPDILENSDFSNNNIQLFPNPVSDTLNIILNNNKHFEIKNIVVYDTTGKEITVSVKSKTSNSISVDVSGVATGIYFCKLYSPNGLLGIKKFVKQ